VAVRTTNTFSEWLQGLIQDIARAKMLQDSIPQLPWLTELETMVLSKAHNMYAEQAQSQMQQSQGVAPTGMPVSPTGGMPPVPPMGQDGNMEALLAAMPAPVAAAPEAVPPGVMAGLGGSMPSNPDELRRILNMPRGG